MSMKIYAFLSIHSALTVYSTNRAASDTPSVQQCHYPYPLTENAP